MRSIEELTDVVRARGGKVTSQRLLIWRALEGDRTHPTAEALLERVKPLLPSLSPATLYSVLNELVEWGDLRRFDAGDGSIHFDPDTSDHAELICLRCHRVWDVRASAAARDVPEEIAGFRVLNHAEQYYGYCADCRRAAGETAVSA
jgi:Fur family transcriptional regulator, peroxide stress response regulator